MTKALPIDQRAKIVSAYNEGLGTAREIGMMFGVTQRSVYTYVQMYNETGDLSSIPIPGRPPILNDENLVIIKDIISSNTDGTLEQYRDTFYDMTGIRVAISTVWKACEILNLRRKKKFFRGGARA